MNIEKMIQELDDNKRLVFDICNYLCHSHLDKEQPSIEPVLSCYELTDDERKAAERFATRFYYFAKREMNADREFERRIRPAVLDIHRFDYMAAYIGSTISLYAATQNMLLSAIIGYAISSTISINYRRLASFLTGIPYRKEREFAETEPLQEMITQTLEHLKSLQENK